MVRTADLAGSSHTRALLHWGSFIPVKCTEMSTAGSSGRYLSQHHLQTGSSSSQLPKGLTFLRPWPSLLHKTVSVVYKNELSLVEKLGDWLQYVLWMPVRTEEGPKLACTVTGRHRGHHSPCAPDPCCQPRELVQSVMWVAPLTAPPFFPPYPLIVPHDEDLPRSCV